MALAKFPAGEQATVFHSYFPNPRVFFLSFLVWCSVTMGMWYAGGASRWGEIVGLPPMEDADRIATVYYFVTNDMLWWYVYYAVSVLIFYGLWFRFSPHPWQRWSVLVSGIILFATAFSVQASVAINNWRRPFFDMLQRGLSGNEDQKVSEWEFYTGVLDFLSIALISITVAVLTHFIVSHYIFRWRTAMNDYYTENWPRLRHIEGASQRVQEDTMRFAETVEALGIRAMDAVLTLIAFMPILVGLGEEVVGLPLLGAIPYPLVTAAIFWSLFGTVLLALAGIKLPGLYFNNQRVEAAFRKELVYGEDNPERAQPLSLSELFSNVRKNYFRLYFHYAYFNVTRYFYLQSDNVFAIVILVPTFAIGKVTFGFFQQTAAAFGQVSNSFQYLVNSWSTIVELMSIHKRLKAFELQMIDMPLPEIDQEWIKNRVTSEP